MQHMAHVYSRFCSLTICYGSASTFRSLLCVKLLSSLLAEHAQTWLLVCIGTQNVISAAAKAKTVKRIIVTGSIVAIAQPGSKLAGAKITEDDWNTDATLEATAYAYSKVSPDKHA